MVKLLRTDTTLDLSQKARVVKISEGRGMGYILRRRVRTDQVMAEVSVKGVRRPVMVRPEDAMTSMCEPASCAQALND